MAAGVWDSTARAAGRRLSVVGEAFWWRTKAAKMSPKSMPMRMRRMPPAVRRRRGERGGNSLEWVVSVGFKEVEWEAIGECPRVRESSIPEIRTRESKTRGLHNRE